MEREKPDEDEEITVGKNIIHNNFDNADFLRNFHFLLQHSCPFYQLHGLHWSCGVKSALGVGRSSYEGSTFEGGTIERSADERSTGPSGTGRTQIGRRKSQATKKLIIHLVPSSKSDLYNFLKKKKEQVLNIYGKDETYKYESHISLTGYFSCENVVIFTKSLYVYLFYYVKLYHLSRKQSMQDLFFSIPCRVGASTCDGRRSSKQCGSREEQQERDREKQLDSQPNSKSVPPPVSKLQPVKCNIKEKHILTTDDGYVIIPIKCEWLKRMFENFRFLIKNDSFTLCRKHSQGGKEKSSKKNLRKRLAVKKKNSHFLCAEDRKHRTEEEPSEEAPLTIHCQGDNATGGRSPLVGEECQNMNNTPLAQHNGDESVLHSCVRGTTGRSSVSSVSTCASSGDLGLYSEVAQVGDNSPAMNPLVCERADAASNSRISGRIRSHRNSRSSRNSGGNKIKYRYNNAKVRLLEFRIKNCNHISLASNRNDQCVQNEIAHMYRDMKYYFSNCTWDMVMFECVDGGGGTEIGNGNATECSQGGNPLLNEIFRFTNFAIS
ncbi:hypothetical protein C922_04659 [Plasmodium inui San Antonio 1]|uniref:Uncharacterized protein n=1 Tax=Plasmodium inui San Antonio 1 TaxID=1237626 RepID=W6ZVW6_9APIC|nr:hypothetical protein C922_04659 [Plasmodium inui San Antonio 1]EUD64927.1 hypothetical protein C922_04659 [Plasmodium inui San Antonio 1]